MSQPVQLPMKWHNFLVKVGLLLGVIGNIGSAIMFFTGVMYETQGLTAAQVYRFFPDLQMLDIIYGVVLVLCAVYTWQTRSALKDFRKAAPSMVLTLYALNAGTSLLYNAAGLILMNGNLADLSSQGTAIVGAVAGVALHRIYYQKRAHLFVN